MWPFRRSRKRNKALDESVDPLLGIDLKGTPQQMATTVLQELEQVLEKYPNLDPVEVTTRVTLQTGPEFLGELASLMAASGRVFELKFMRGRKVLVRLYTAQQLE